MKGDIPKWSSCEGNMYRSRGTRLHSQCVSIYGGIHVFQLQWFFFFRSTLPFPAVVDTAFLIRSASVHVDESYLSNEEKCILTIKYHLSFAYLLQQQQQQFLCDNYFDTRKVLKYPVKIHINNFSLSLSKYYIFIIIIKYNC